ncbi:MAG: hypothetical protein GX630_03065 [Actinobacteria bacterium]|nr:hypothetical protein [Actinomycetota bacterium]
MLIKIKERYVGVATPYPLEAGEHDLPDRVAAYFLRTFSGAPFFAQLVNPPAEPEAPATVDETPEEAPQDETAEPAEQTDDETEEATESEEQTETVAQTMEPEETQIVKPTAPATRPRGRGRQPSRRK